MASPRSCVLQADRAKLDPSIPFFGMFDITAYGFPYAVFGIVYVVVFSPWLLPPMQQWGRYAKLPEADEEELLVGLQVEKYSPVVGKTIEVLLPPRKVLPSPWMILASHPCSSLQAAGLRSLDKVYLTSVERGGYPIPAVWLLCPFASL